MPENPILLPVTLELENGDKHEAEVRVPLRFQDRLAFETRFRKASSMLDRGIEELGRMKMIDPDYPDERPPRFVENPAFDPAKVIQHEHLAFLAWCDLRRRGLFTGPWEVLRDQLDEIQIGGPASPIGTEPIDELDEEEREADPTPAPSGTVASSPSSSPRRSGTTKGSRKKRSS